MVQEHACDGEIYTQGVGATKPATMNFFFFAGFLGREEMPANDAIWLTGKGSGMGDVQLERR